MAKKSNKKSRKKFRAFILIISLVSLAIFIGIKGGEFMAYKLAKPIEGNDSILGGITGEGKKGDTRAIAEDDMVVLTAVATEFIAAEHMKKNDTLASLVNPDYYSTLLKSMKTLSTREVEVQDMSFKNISSDNVRVEMVYLKNGKKSSEVVSFKRDNGTWKVAKVER